MMIMMIRKFLADERGGYALMTAAAIVPIMGALALAVDYSEMTKQRQETLNALDAAGIATARRIVEGATDEEAKAYAKQFFEANLGSVEPGNATLSVVLPKNNTGGGTLKLSAALKYKPFFFPTFASLIGKASATTETLDFAATSEVQLKNTLEVALVLDNSGSMTEMGEGSSKVRFVLLKEAAKELVDTLAKEAEKLQQVNKPVQFALVPFAASVNVGADKATATWMDQDGLSPIHHENFDWSTFTASDKKVQLFGGVYYKKGAGWGAQEDQKVTRFTLFNDMRRVTGSHQEQTGTTTQQQCGWSPWPNWVCNNVVVPVYTTVQDYGPYAGWAGCVESRPDPYNKDDTTPSTSTPATLFVPMFAPDEPGDKWATSSDQWPDDYGAYNNWWNDGTEDSSGANRQKYMPKYFDAAPLGTAAAPATGQTGPNGSCTTKAITPLTDVTTTAGKDAIKAAIDGMVAEGATNVPEGMAWGWRVISHPAPFTEGRAESEKGNDKVLIVLTDGANTYYDPQSLGANDPAGNKSIYSNFGYAGKITTGYSNSRIFEDTTVTKTDYSRSNYTKAMNQHFEELCSNAKSAGLIVMTVALDLDYNNATEKGQIDALTACASESRFRKNPDTGAAEKNFWNTTGGDLSKTFKVIADELSNLRIVG